MNTKRNLDGCYFRVCRNDEWESVCFSDLTHGEREEIVKDKNPEFLKSLCYHLADQLKTIGNELDIMGE